MRRIFSLLSSLIPLFTMPAALAQEFKEGQVWSYRARANEQGSTVLINKIEKNERLGAIFHISVNGVKVKNPRAPRGITENLPHFPVSKKTLEISVVELMGAAAPNPAYREGYAIWKKAFDAGEAGIFTISVLEIVEFIEKTVNQ